MGGGARQLTQQLLSNTFGLISSFIRFPLLKGERLGQPKRSDHQSTMSPMQKRRDHLGIKQENFSDFPHYFKMIWCRFFWSPWVKLDHLVQEVKWLVDTIISQISTGFNFLIKKEIRPILRCLSHFIVIYWVLSLSISFWSKSNRLRNFKYIAAREWRKDRILQNSATLCCHAVRFCPSHRISKQRTTPSELSSVVYRLGGRKG